MITIPSKSTKTWSTSQNGDYLGNIVRSRGLNFNKKGVLSLAKKPIVLYTKTDDSHFRIPLAICNDSTYFYVLTSNGLLYFNDMASDITPLIDSSLAFGVQSDACFFNGSLHATFGNLFSYNPATPAWTGHGITLSSLGPQPVCVSEHQQYIAIGNLNTVKLYDTTYTLITTLTIPADLFVTWIRWRGNQLYIGTRNINGGTARFIIWDGSGTAAQNSFGVEANWIYSGCEYDSSIAVITSSGQLLRFNGGGFTELASLPVYNASMNWSSLASNVSLIGRVSSRGMVASGKRIYINLDGSIITSQGLPDMLPKQPSGLWQYDPDVGLYHKSGYGNKKYQRQVNISSVTSNVLTIASAAVFETGDPVLASSGVGGFTLNPLQIYYAIKVSPTTLKLALSYSDAVAGRNITVTGTTSSGDNLSFETYLSVGSTRISQPGAVALIGGLAPSLFHGSEVFFGGETTNNANAAIDVLMSLGLGKNVGSFITPKIESAEVTSAYQKIITKFNALNLPSQKVLIKYKVVDTFGLPVAGAINTSAGLAVWVTANSFTVDATNYDFKSVAIGNEIEFTQGSAAGYTAHITNITNVGNTYTVTLDESMPNITASDKANFLVDSWIKIGEIDSTSLSNDAILGWSKISIGKKQKWVQFKVELRGFMNEFEELNSLDASDQTYA